MSRKQQLRLVLNVLSSVERGVDRIEMLTYSNIHLTRKLAKIVVESLPDDGSADRTAILNIAKQALNKLPIIDDSTVSSHISEHRANTPPQVDSFPYWLPIVLSACALLFAAASFILRILS